MDIVCSYSVCMYMLCKLILHMYASYYYIKSILLLFLVWQSQQVTCYPDVIIEITQSVAVYLKYDGSLYFTTLILYVLAGFVDSMVRT